MGIYDREYYQDGGIRPMRPWDGRSMVTLIIIACTAIFVANFLFTGRSDALNHMLELRPSDLLKPWNWYRFVTYGFSHSSSIFHVLFNMLTLYFLGRNVEDKYGKWEFFRIYLVSIILCGIGWALLHYGSEPSRPVRGASGAVTTIAMMFVFSFPMATLMLYGVLPVKAWMVGIAMVVMNLFGSTEQVAYEVHLIGAALAACYFFSGMNLHFLGGWLDVGKSLFKPKRSLKVHRPAAWSEEGDPPSKPSRDEAEADRLLDKIYREGKESLTPREQSFLENYSRKVRSQRR